MSALPMGSFGSIADLPEDAGFATFFWHLYSKEKYTDVHFNVEINDSEMVSFSAHKLVLALRSPFFSDLLCERDDEEKITNVIPLTGVNPIAFKAMLNYIYDMMPPLKTPKMIREVYKVAEKFQVFRLMSVCRERLNKMEITFSNIFDMLEAADYIQNKSKKDACLNFIQNNTKKVMDSYKFSEISPSMISIFLSLKKMSLDSVLALFKWIFAWAESRIDENSEYNTIRKSVEEFLTELPFLSLSYKEFAELYLCYTDAFDDNEVISIFMNLALPGSQKLPDWYNQKHTVEIKSQ